MGCCGSKDRCDDIPQNPTDAPIASKTTQPPNQSSVTSQTSASSSQATSRSSNASSSSGFSNATSAGTPEANNGLRRFRYKDLQQMTRNFDSALVLGEGGFGMVYRGSLPAAGGAGEAESDDVAIKVLNEGGSQGENEWLAEIFLLQALSHPNLVNLRGYSCDQGRPKVLVYDLAHRGSLDAVLFDARDSPVLTWNERMQIAVDAASGLEYLHSKNVIHRDFKPANVLLDRSLRARVSDFGLAKTGPDAGGTHVSTAVKGTMAYLDPKYWETGHLTTGSDVFSFGVTLLELISGRPSGQNLTAWARPLLAPQRPHADRIVDPRLEGKFPKAAAIMSSVIAKKCIEKDPALRPPMSVVRKHLQKVLETSQ